MDKSHGMDTISKTISGAKFQAAKYWNIAKLKVEIGALRKRKDEKLKALGRRALDLLEKGKLNADLFEPQYSSLLKVDDELKELEAQEEGVKKTHMAEWDEHDADLSEMNASAAPVVPETDEEEKAEENGSKRKE